MPCHNKQAAIITRKKVGEDLMRMFLPIKETPPFVRFGIIIGPSESRKTHAVREFCNKFPEGVLNSDQFQNVWYLV